MLSIIVPLAFAAYLSGTFLYVAGTRLQDGFVAEPPDPLPAAFGTTLGSPAQAAELVPSESVNGHRAASAPPPSPDPAFDSHYIRFHPDLGICSIIGEAVFDHGRSDRAVAEFEEVLSRLSGKHGLGEPERGEHGEEPGSEWRLYVARWENGEQATVELILDIPREGPFTLRVEAWTHFLPARCSPNSWSGFWSGFGGEYLYAAVVAPQLLAARALGLVGNPADVDPEY